MCARVLNAFLLPRTFERAKKNICKIFYHATPRPLSIYGPFDGLRRHLIIAFHVETIEEIRHCTESPRYMSLR